MRKLLFAFVVFPFVVFGQHKVFTNKVSFGSLTSGDSTVNITGGIKVSGGISVNNIETHEQNHFYASFAVAGNDTVNGSSPGVVIPITARYQWAKCSQSTSTLIVTEAHNFTISNDTITYTGNNGDMRIEASISLAMATNEDYDFALWNITDNTLIGNKQAVSSSSITNIANVFIRGYDINATNEDKYVLKLRNLTSASSPFLYYLDVFGIMIDYE